MVTGTKAKQYKGHRSRQLKRYTAISEAGRDIGMIPPVADPARKIASLRSFRVFCETYYAKTFFKPWGRNHLAVIARIEEVVLRGGLFALALPRGEGKTSLCEAAVCWATLAGHRRFVVLVGSDGGHAESGLTNIKMEMETNELLASDFPEALYPIQCLEGIPLRAIGQTYQGRRVMAVWRRDEVVMPTIPGNKSSGTVIRASGLEGSIRGMNFKRPDGGKSRPDLVILDDPQTDQSARSPTQVKTRKDVLMGAVLGLAGPGKEIAAVVPCTVICKDDLADQILDRDKQPRWQGLRYKMVNTFPTNEKLWAEYAVIQVEDLQAGGKGTKATEFYKANREAMDAGADVAWDDRYSPGELSALQHAMNLKLRDEPAFFSEYQNEPKNDELKKLDLMAADICQSVNGFEMGIIPPDATIVTMMVDIQEGILFYLVVAWTEQFTGYVVEYGTAPDQKAEWFTTREARHTLKELAPEAGFEGRLHAGLKWIEKEVIARNWPSEGGRVYRVDRCVIDANWAQSTDLVYAFCHRSELGAILIPSHGYYVGASSWPMSDYKRKPGDRVGTNWRIPKNTNARPVPHLLFDTNYWKSFSHSRFLTPEGDYGRLSVWGRDPKRHELFAMHATAEYYVRTSGRNREVDEWKLPPSKPDNHWLDCLVGCCVGASMQGAVVRGQDKPKGGRRKGKKISLRAIQQAKQEQRYRGR